MSATSETIVAGTNAEPVALIAPVRKSRVICFVSPKGGTGKTVFSATTAYLLVKAGKRVVCIDTDFSTRGLSLYLLGNASESASLDVLPENCLADCIHDDDGPTRIKPRPIFRRGLVFETVLSNRELWRGGVPDERIVGGSSSPDAPTNIHVYFRRMKAICDRLRSEYDYIILDTRGGYDYTSAVPALIADGYVIVLEADAISMEQVHGFKQRMTELAASLEAQVGEPAFLRGAIINKAAYPASDKTFPTLLNTAYGIVTFGTVPVDRNVIRAYQNKDIPAETFPDSDFSFYGSKAVENLLLPKQNWSDPKQIQSFDASIASIRRAWVTRVRSERLLLAAPFAHLFWVLASLALYLVYKTLAYTQALTAFYLLASMFVLWSTSIAGFGTLQYWQRTEKKRAFRLVWAVTMFLVFGALTYTVAIDLPRMLRNQQGGLIARLYERIDDQNSVIASRTAELQRLQSSVQDINSKAGFLQIDLQRSKADNATLQAELDMTRRDLVQLSAQLYRTQPTTRLKTTRFYEEACAGGDASGCSTLGTMYEKGTGVPMDAVHAAKLYKLACDKGDPNGCANSERVSKMLKIR